MSGLKFSLGGSKRPLNGKLAFGLKANAVKPKPAAVFGDESDGEELDDKEHVKRQRTVAQVVPPPLDPEVKKVADRLAEFVAKHGRKLEETTKERNPDDSKFRFLFDTTSSDYKYYSAKVEELQRKLKDESKVAVPTARNDVSSRDRNSSPGAKLLSEIEEPEKVAVKQALATGDSLAAMDAFAKIAAKKAEEKAEREQRVQLLNETSFDRRRVAAVFKADGSRGHHMQDFIPPEEMAKMLAKSGDEFAQAQAKALEDSNRISSDNIGHKLLQKMGWKEGEGLGTAGKGIAAPISATGMAWDTSGLGASKVSDIQEGDDAFEQYRKRMMLGYKYRPNPLGNPRKQYY